MRKFPKRILAGLLTAAVAAAMTGCGSSSGQGQTSAQTQAATATDESPEENGAESDDAAGEVSEPAGEDTGTEGTGVALTNVNPNLATRVTDEEDHYIFELDENVTREKVYYFNRFGIEIAADLYMAKDADLTQQYPAVVVGPPFGGVKEQGPGVYANELAQRGFVVLAFDPAYHGYSGGQPRLAGSTSLYAEDFSAAVDYLGTREFVDRDKIGAIGICGSGGFALAAAGMDTRIKAVVTSVMYDITGIMNQISGEQRQQMLEADSLQRWEDFENGTARQQLSYPEEPDTEMPEGLDPVTEEFYSFYGMERGHHPNALGNLTIASVPDTMNFPSLTHISEISPRPILFIAGENAHSLGYSEEAYANAAEPKELYVVPGANHVDLYDQVDKIPFDKIESFLNEALN